MTEFELINFLTKDVPQQAPNLKQGIGDDCAVFAGDRQDWIITTDMLLEGIHFDLSYTVFYALGRKSLSVNLSDIAAMGGQPAFFTINIGVPKNISLAQLGEFYQGLLAKAKESDVLLVGGDTSSSQKGLVISITLLGKTEKAKAILRKGARPGDLIYVTGQLGSAALGLKCYLAGKTAAKTKPFLEKFNDPQPRLAVGSWLREKKLATAMIDISDGLLSDLGHLAGNSQVGYRLEIDKIPVLDNFQNIARELGLDPWALALAGGEDYELVFTVAPQQRKIIEKDLLAEKDRLECSLTQVGEIVADPGQQIVLDKNGKKIDFGPKGYDHFG